MCTPPAHVVGVAEGVITKAPMGLDLGGVKWGSLSENRWNIGPLHVRNKMKQPGPDKVDEWSLCAPQDPTNQLAAIVAAQPTGCYSGRPTNWLL